MSLDHRRFHAMLRHAAGWIRAIGLGSIAVGLFGFLPVNFWLGIGSAYFGSLVILSDLLFLERFGITTKRQRLLMRTVLSLIPLGFATWITFYFVLKHAPWEIFVFIAPGSHQVGSDFGGFTWKDANASDLRITVTNAGDIPYEGVDVVIDTDAYIESVGQLQAMPRCEISLSKPLQNVYRVSSNNRPARTFSPASRATLGVGYRVTCAHFPVQSSIQLVLAISDQPPLYVDANESHPEGWQGAFVWEAKPNIGAHIPPRMVTIKGSYTARYRDRTVNQSLTLKRLEQ